MCGLAGFLLPTVPESHRSMLIDDHRKILERMAELLGHRGPDERALWGAGPVGFAHTRLAIQDLSENAAQPMATQDGCLRIVFNGEIYNHKSLRRDLEALGHRFCSNSDTEAILHGFREWGTDLFPKLQGMFAIAIWDSKTTRLWLARDPLGKKPLVIANVAKTFLFASESKALFAWPGVTRTPHLESLLTYLVLHYVPGPKSAFCGIQKVTPGTFLCVQPGKAPKAHRFHRWADDPAEVDKPESAILEELRCLIDLVVRSRLQADVPIGAFLSGGVDSSTVTTVMARYLPRGLHTFSASFKEPQFDERREATAIASHAGAKHRQVIVDSTAIEETVRQIAWLYGEPFGDPSAIPTYAVAKLARQHVKVVLTGDGGDECWLGYNRYSRLPPLRPTDKRSWRWKMGRFVDHRKPHPMVDNWFSSFCETLAGRLRPHGLAASELYAVHFAGNDPGSRLRAVVGPLLRPTLASDPLAAWNERFREQSDLLSGSSWTDLHTYLVDDILVKIDIATMAVGLEARCPLLDTRLIDFALKIPVSIRRRFGQPKWLFRAAVRPWLPSSTIDRPKQGFALPLAEWIRGPAGAMIADVLRSRQCRERGFLNDEILKTMIDEHRSGSADHNLRLWNAYMLEQWALCWLDGGAPDRIET